MVTGKHDRRAFISENRSERIRRRIRTLMDFAGMSEMDLARESDMRQQTLSDVLAGKTEKIRVETLYKIIKAFTKRFPKNSDLDSFLSCETDGLDGVEWQIGSDSLQLPYDSPPQAHLAQYIFTSNCKDAFLRDLFNAYLDSPIVPELYNDYVDAFVDSIRSYLLPDFELTRLTLFGSVLNSEDWSDAVVAGMAYAAAILRPWFDGSEKLQYHVIPNFGGFPEPHSE